MGLFSGILDSVPIVGPLLNGVFAHEAQRDTNEANVQLSRDQMQFQRESQDKTFGFNSAEAEKNRQWQQMMSSTAYSRAVGDMTSAGLNPMLAYQQGGASTPGGATAGGSAQPGSTTRVESPTAAGLQAVFSSAQVQNMLQQNKLLEAQEGKERSASLELDSRAALNYAQVPSAAQQARHLEKQAEWLEKMIDADMPHYQREKVLDEIAEIRAKVHLLNAEGNSANDFYRARADLERSEATNVGLKIPQMRREAEYWKSDWSKYRLQGDDVIRGIGSASGLWRARSSGIAADAARRQSNRYSTSQWESDGSGYSYSTTPRR